MNLSRSTLFKVLAIVLGLAAALGIGEALLRAFYPLPEQYYANVPGIRYSLHPREGILPGVHGTAKYYTNSLGIRGEPFKENQDVRILAIGGSTTECLYLDTEEAWPRLLQQKLDSFFSKQTVWVGNIGRSGYTTRKNNVQLNYLLPQYPRIDVILAMVGVNDMLQVLANNGQPLDSISHQSLLQNTLISRFRETSENWLLQTATGFLLAQLKEAIALYFREDIVQDELAEVFLKWRSYRQQADTILHQLPPMEQSLENFQDRLKTMDSIAKQHGSKLILVSHPAIWHEGIDTPLQKLLWMGGVGNFQEGESETYYSATALANGLEQMNWRMEEVARQEEGLFFFDLAPKLSRDTTVFYDDVHFNEAGARKVATLLQSYFKTKRDTLGLVP